MGGFLVLDAGGLVAGRWTLVEVVSVLGAIRIATRSLSRVQVSIQILKSHSVFETYKRFELLMQYTCEQRNT